MAFSCKNDDPVVISISIMRYTVPDVPQVLLAPGLLGCSDYVWGFYLVNEEMSYYTKTTQHDGVWPVHHSTLTMGDQPLRHSTVP